MRDTSTMAEGKPRLRRKEDILKALRWDVSSSEQILQVEKMRKCYGVLKRNRVGEVAKKPVGVGWFMMDAGRQPIS